MPSQKDLDNFIESFNNDISESELEPDQRVVDLAHKIINDINEPNLSDTIERKFEESFSVKDYEVLTDEGWKDIKNIGKTIEYEVWEVKTENGYTLIGADNHIVFDYDWDEVYLKYLNKDSRPDYIITEKGPSRVTSVKCLGYSENMYDIEVDSEKHRFWSNGILSHNSIWLANDAANFFRQGKNVACISGEMEDKKFLKRLGANILDIHIDEYESFAQDTKKVQSKLNYMTDTALIPPGDLHIKQMAAPTVPQIEMYLKEYEEKTGIKLEVIVIDYINILTNYRNPNSENTYLKVKQIAEDLRAMAIRNDWVIITATQISRCIDKNSELITPNGKVKIKNIKEGDLILNENNEFIKVKNKSEKQIQEGFLIKTKSGKFIKVGKNHRLPNNKGEMLKAHEYKVGEKIISATQINKIKLLFDGFRKIFLFKKSEYQKK